MASSLVGSLAKSVSRNSSSCRWFAAKPSSSYGLNRMTEKEESVVASDEIPQEDDDATPTSGLSRPLSEILKELNKRVPDSLVRVRTEADGFPVKYIPWYVNIYIILCYLIQDLCHY
ncbi:unnamed protein product [Ilex paraguariensis]|uniref:Uncharacterized protein n=2 Tax=Ilex paraguariensis TaxID=185542 RepID=A0ABC8QUK2_9AQUA